MSDKKTVEDSVEDMWLAVKKATENVFERALLPDELGYLLTRYPALEICDEACPFYQTRVPTLHQASSGWVIFDFGSVLVTSACDLLSRPGLPGHSGKGTIFAQYANTALEMVDLVKKKAWKGVEIVSGLYAMQRIFWARASVENEKEKMFEIRGFNPTIEDMVVKNWLSGLWEGTLYKPKNAGPAG